MLRSLFRRIRSPFYQVLKMPEKMDPTVPETKVMEERPIGGPRSMTAQQGVHPHP
ncbi:MAG: hypothetical protein AB7E52_04490 [Bdellovibrionales bacterium]